MSDIQLSKQQSEAISAIGSWYHAPIRDRKAFILNGYAGVGKSELARQIPELILNEPQDNIIYAAPTGKASLQLKKKGCERVLTLHKLLYSPMEKDRTALLDIAKALREELEKNPQGDSEHAVKLKRDLHQERKRVATPSWQLKKPDIDSKVKMIIVDEASMVDERIYNDLLALDKPILFIGDPFQLPPVFGVSPVMSQQPDYVLTEVHRQAKDSPILQAATSLRNGEYPTAADNTDQFKIIPVSEATYEHYSEADQILCGRNKTRRALNAKIRKRLVDSGKLEASTLPLVKGDRIVFLRNDHDDQIFNGTIARVTSATQGIDDSHENVIIDAVDDAGNIISGYEIWPGVLEGYDIHEAPRHTQVADFSWAITAHKGQGSEWNSVLVHSEPTGHGIDMLRWLYTAITRAQNKCIVVSKEG